MFLVKKFRGLIISKRLLHILAFHFNIIHSFKAAKDCNFYPQVWYYGYISPVGLFNSVGGDHKIGAEISLIRIMGHLLPWGRLLISPKNGLGVVYWIGSFI